MSDLVPFDARPGLRRSESRQLARSAAQLDARTQLTITRIEQAADVQATKTDAIAYVARRGMQNVAMITRLEASLATLVPMASGRLAAIGDMASLSIAEVVNDTAHRVR